MHHFCTVHNRKATHQDADGRHRCDPALGGVTMSCIVELRDVGDNDLLRELNKLRKRFAKDFNSIYEIFNDDPSKFLETNSGQATLMHMSGFDFSKIIIAWMKEDLKFIHEDPRFKDLIENQGSNSPIIKPMKRIN